MAIVLKNTSRCEVRPEFWDALSHYANEMGVSMVENIQGARNERMAKKLAKEYASTFANIKKATQRDPHLETVLVHSKWDVIKSNAFNELVFYKEDPKMFPIRYADRYPTYRIGPYEAVVKRGSFHISNPKPSGNIEFRPKQDPSMYKEDSPLGYWNYERYYHPHQKRHNTCWGSYGSWLLIALKRFNIADMQEAMYKFLTHYTPGDTLADPGRSFPFYEPVEKPQ